MLRFLLIVWLACVAIGGISFGAVMLWLEPEKMLGVYLGAVGALALAAAMLLIGRWRLL